MELLINNYFRDVTSLGEIYMTYVRRDQRQKVCTCGKNKSLCPVWSHVDFEISDFEEFYGNVLAASETDRVTDSSKSLEIFKRYHLKEKDEFFVVFLRKELPSYYQSAKKRAQRESDPFRRTIKYHSARIVLGWLFHNVRMIWFVRRQNVAHMMTTYEDLCDRTGAVLEQLSDLSGMEKKKEPGINHAHLLRGNRMRYEFVNNVIVRPYEKGLDRTFLGAMLAKIDSIFSRCFVLR